MICHRSGNGPGGSWDTGWPGWAAGMLIAAGLSVWQAEWQAVGTPANATAEAEELDLLDFEGQILGRAGFQIPRF